MKTSNIDTDLVISGKYGLMKVCLQHTVIQIQFHTQVLTSHYLITDFIRLISAMLDPSQYTTYTIGQASSQTDTASSVYPKIAIVILVSLLTIWFAHLGLFSGRSSYSYASFIDCKTQNTLTQKQCEALTDLYDSAQIQASGVKASSGGLIDDDCLGYDSPSTCGSTGFSQSGNTQSLTGNQLEHNTTSSQDLSKTSYPVRAGLSKMFLQSCIYPILHSIQDMDTHSIADIDPESGNEGKGERSRDGQSRYESIQMDIQQFTTYRTTSTAMSLTGGCGTAARIYDVTHMSGRGNDTFCRYGTPTPSALVFPSIGSQVSRTCEEDGGGNHRQCRAYHLDQDIVSHLSSCIFQGDHQDCVWYRSSSLSQASMDSGYRDQQIRSAQKQKYTYNKTTTIPYILPETLYYTDLEQTTYQDADPRDTTHSKKHTQTKNVSIGSISHDPLMSDQRTLTDRWNILTDTGSLNADYYLVAPRLGCILAVHEVLPSKDPANYQAIKFGAMPTDIAQKYLQYGAMKMPDSPHAGGGGNMVIFSDHIGSCDHQPNQDPQSISGLRIGDLVAIHERQHDGSYIMVDYMVTANDRVDPSQTSVLLPGMGINMTLITCRASDHTGLCQLVKLKSKEELEHTKKYNNLTYQIAKEKKGIIQSYLYKIANSQDLHQAEKDSKIQYLRYRMAGLPDHMQIQNANLIDYIKSESLDIYGSGWKNQWEADL